MTDDAAPKPEPKQPWERPSLTFLGSVADLVLGIGKTGPNSDGDPFGGFKNPGGG